MRDYCIQVQAHGMNEVYKSKFQKAKEWYKQQHNKYSAMLRNEMYGEMQSDIDSKDNPTYFSIEEYSDNFGSKLSLYCILDFICKHILSCYTYGPTPQMGLNFTNGEYYKSWFEVRRDAAEIIEILQYVLQKNCDGQKLNLATLLEDRDVRNGLAHGDEIAACMSAIRCYNILRDMLIFIDDECSSELPKFVYPLSSGCPIQSFFEHSANLDFENTTTVLIVGALHDIQQDYKMLFANLAWDIVVDFDGISSFGGLRSAVTHNRVRDQLLTSEVVKNFLLTRGATTWLTCGDFVSYSYNALSKQVQLIPQKTPFYKGKDYNNYRYMSNLLDGIFDKVAAICNPVNIVFMHSDERIAMEVIGHCESKLQTSSYTFTGIYYLPQSKIQQIENVAYRQHKLQGNDYSSQFLFMSTSIESFFEGIDVYKHQFVTRTMNINGNCLPSNEGLKQIGINDSVNLECYFDVLYSDCGNESPEEALALITKFYHGGVAPWCAFQNKEYADLLPNSEFEKRINAIKSKLGYIPENKADKIFYIEHMPGIGGSTLLRHIGWSLHDSFPVLLAKKYDKSITKIITALYDHLYKGIVVLADESFDQIDELEQDIMNTPRACVLIISVRKGMSSHSLNQKIPFVRITDFGENQLRAHYKKYSPMSEADINKKDQDYYSFIRQDSTTMRCPFMIGLYYMEKDFFGILDYVNQITRKVNDIKELSVMSFICLADIYGHVTIPASLVNTYLGLSPRDNYLYYYPYVSSAFLRIDNKGTTTYVSKHYLISQYLLQSCIKKIYNGLLNDHLQDIASAFIDFVLKICNDGVPEILQNILEKIFITGRAEAYYGIQSTFSQIIEDIQTPEARKHIMMKLATDSAQIADKSTHSNSFAACMMTSHFYGHLSRLCSKRSAGIENATESEKYCLEAIKYMDMCGRQDPVVYHMYGDAKFNLLKTKLDEFKLKSETLTSAEYANIENEVDQIIGIFDKASEAGSPEYALVSQISLLLSYTKFIYRVKNIRSSKDFSKLSDKQSKYRVDIEEMIAQLDGLNLSKDSVDIFIKLEDEYRTDVMLLEFGKVIEYYNNKLSELQKKSGMSHEISIARRGLISARLSKYRNISKTGHVFYSRMPSDEADVILQLLEDSLLQSIDASNYQERSRRIVSYSRWFKISKFSNRSVDKGIEIALNWERLELMEHRSDPRPYYYLYVLYYLSVLDGSKSNWENAMRYQKVAMQKAQDRGLNVDSLRDLLTDGTGINRLYDVSQTNNLVDEIAKQKIQPIQIGGYFSDIQSKKGIVEIREPISWHGASAKFRVGVNNSIGKHQITHDVRFYGGFSYEQIVAVDASVRDISSGEALNAELVGARQAVTEKVVQNYAPPKPSSDFVVKEGDIVFFRPEKLHKNPRGDLLFLNGLVDDFQAILPYRDLLLYIRNDKKSKEEVERMIIKLFKDKKPFKVAVEKIFKDKTVFVSLYMASKAI